MVHGEEVKVPFRLALSIAVLSRNYMITNRKPNAKKADGWKKPPEGRLMINVGASFDLDSGRGATGVIIRDFWAVYCSFTKFLPHVVDDPMAEAYSSKKV